MYALLSFYIYIYKVHREGVALCDICEERRKWRMKEEALEKA